MTRFSVGRSENELVRSLYLRRVGRGEALDGALVRRVVSLGGVDAVEGRAPEEARQVDVERRHDGEDEDGLDDSYQVLGNDAFDLKKRSQMNGLSSLEGVLFFYPVHDESSGLSEGHVELCETGSQNSAENPHEHRGQHRDHVHRDQVLSNDKHVFQDHVVSLINKKHVFTPRGLQIVEFRTLAFVMNLVLSSPKSCLYLKQ